MEMSSVRAAPAEAPGDLVRRVRKKKGITLCELGKLTGYSTAQVSRYERGICPLADVHVLRRFADALGIRPEEFGLTSHGTDRHTSEPPYPRVPVPTLGTAPEEGDVRRRHFLAMSAAAAASRPPTTAPAAEDEAHLGERLVARLRDAMLGLGPAGTVPPEQLPLDLDRCHLAFRACRYADLAGRLPRLIRSAHATGSPDHSLLARSYLLATRVLVKLDEQHLGWMAADRARQCSEAAGDPLTVAESARQLAVLARTAGWHDQALTIALTAADAPALRESGAPGAAARGLLIQSAAYTVARAGDLAGMRELTGEAAAIARDLRTVLAPLRDQAGGFSAATVQLHLISASTAAGDPSAAIAAAKALAPAALPTVERRARYHYDVATAYSRWGRREECIRSLLAAERCAPQDTHARPAVRALVSGLLVSGRATPELRGLATRTGALPA